MACDAAEALNNELAAARGLADIPNKRTYGVVGGWKGFSSPVLLSCSLSFVLGSFDAVSQTIVITSDLWRVCLPEWV